MKVYVASSFARKSDVSAMIALLREEGHEVTYDWTPEDASGLEGEALHDALRGGAERDLSGVFAAEVLIVLHDDRGRGMATEFGIAIGLGTPSIVVAARVAQGEMRNVFYYLPSVIHADTPKQAVGALRVLNAMKARAA